MKIALSQISMIFEDKNSNYIMVEEFVRQASENNCDLIIFPEMTCTGFSMNNKLIGEDDDKTLNYMKSLSCKYNLKICFGQVIIKDNKYYNNMTIVDHIDELLSYDKIHPFTFESNYYSKGNQIKTCKIDNLTLSGFICYDLRFPEIFQRASRDSDIIIVIASWPDKRDDHWLTLLKARAIENQCYVIGVNRVGKDPSENYLGHSVVFDGFGNLLTRMSEDEENLYIDVNLEDIINSLQGTNFKKDRRDDLYYQLMKETK